MRGSVMMLKEMRGLRGCGEAFARSRLCGGRVLIGAAL
jgi:hypothetical protein